MVTFLEKLKKARKEEIKPEVVPKPEVRPPPPPPTPPEEPKRVGLLARIKAMKKPPAKPLEKPPPKPVPEKPPVKDTRKLEEVPEKERAPVEAELMAHDSPVLRELAKQRDLVPWQRELVKQIVVKREETLKETERAKEVAKEIELELPEIPSEIEATLKYSPEEFTFALTEFAKQEPRAQEALALDLIKRGIGYEEIRSLYESGAMDLSSLDELVEAISEVTIPNEFRYMQPVRRKMRTELENFLEVAHMNERARERIEKLDEERRRREAEKPPTPEEMEVYRKELIDMADGEVKRLYEESQKTDMASWQRLLLMEEAFTRGLIEYAPEEKLEQVGIEVIHPPESVTYEYFLDKRGNLSRKRFETFMEKRGIDFTKPKHKDVAELIWAFLKKNKALPKWEEIPREKRAYIDRPYRGYLMRTYRDYIDTLVEKGEVKSPEKFAGMMWTKYGREWIPIPPHELGIEKVAYPGGMTPEAWRNKFLSVVMKSPYKAGPKRAQELWNKYGRLGKMPPFEEFKFPPEIEEYISRGVEPADVDAVMKFFEHTERPVTFEDLLTLFSNDEARAKKAYELMFEYTDAYFESIIKDILGEMTMLPEGEQKLRDIALSDNRALLASIIGERVRNFNPREKEFIDFAYDTLIEFIPRSQSGAEMIDFMEQMREMTADQRRVDLQLEMEKIRPSWDDVQVYSTRKELINKWKSLSKELGRRINAVDFFMRYPEISKREARAVEEALKFQNIEDVYGKMSLDKIKKMVPELQKKISDYKAGKDKAELSKDIYLLERLNDLHRLATKTDIVDKMVVGTIGEVDFSDAKAFALGRFKKEWVFPEDYEMIETFIREKLRVPSQAELHDMFGDAIKARFIADMFIDKYTPLGIELDDETIIRMAERMGYTGDEIKEAVAAYRTGRALPLDAIERHKKAVDKERRRALEKFRAILERPVAPEVLKRIGEIKTMSATQVEALLGFNEMIAELEKKLGRVERGRDVLTTRKRDLEEKRVKGKKKMLEEIEKNMALLEEGEKDLIRSIHELKSKRWDFIRTLPVEDYTRGMATINYKDYIGRRVNVKRRPEEAKGRPVDVNLEDIYKFWVAPIERAREEFIEKHEREPNTHELMEMEPSMEEIIEKEKDIKRAVPHHDKRVAVITLMNYAKESGAYPFEYQMADFAWTLGVKDVPVFVLPADTPEGREQQFKNWLKFGLKRHEVEGWAPHIQYEFIGDDWMMCDWTGSPKKREDVRGQKEHLKKCALKKAKVIQGAALQFIEPRVLQPIVQEIAEAPPSEEVAELLKQIDNLKGDLKSYSREAVKAKKLSKDAIEELEKLSTEKAECEAELDALSEELEEIKKEAVAAMEVAVPPKARRKRVKREAVEAEAKRKEAELKELDKRMRALAKKLKPGKEKELLEDLEKELKATKRKLSKALKEVRAVGRDFCFLFDEWNTIKLSISEHMATNTRLRQENQQRLMAARTAGLDTEISMYENYDKSLREEAGALAGLRDYIRVVEREHPDRFLCTPAEMKVIRSMSPAEIVGEEEERVR